MKFQKIISELNINNQIITLAFSGGSDSCFMLDLFLKLGIKVDLIYVNYITKKNSEIEKDFVKKKSEEINSKLHMMSVNIKSLAKKENKGYKEMTRDVRYRFYSSIPSLADCIVYWNITSNVKSWKANLTAKIPTSVCSVIG